MADTLCGPANPLQSFQKYSQADRTLQQDRFISRQQPGAQDFRSEPSADSALLEHQFEAFQAAQLPHDAFEGSPHQQQPPRFHPSPAYVNGIGQGGWANDFAKLQIAPQPTQDLPAPSLQRQLPQQLQQNTTSWHGGFAATQQPSPPVSNLSSQPYQPRFSGFGTGSPFSNVQQPLGYVSPSVQHHASSTQQCWKGKGRWQPEDHSESAAWEAEFEALAEEQVQQVGLAQQQQQQHGSLSGYVDQVVDSAAGFRSFDLEPTMEDRKHLNLHQSTEAMQRPEDQEARLEMKREHDERFAEQLRGFDHRLSANGLLPPGEHGMETMRRMPGHESTLDPQQGQLDEDPQLQAQPDVDAELAHTAGVLLDTVADNQSEKFQQSSFLALMRQFRDHEVKVEGDKVVGVHDSNEQVCEYERIMRDI